MDVVNILTGLVAFALGASLAWYFLGKGSSVMKVRLGQLADELEILHRDSSNKTHEWNQSLNQRSTQHANELAKLRDEYRTASDVKENEWRLKLRTGEERAFADGQRQAELRQEKIDKAFSVKIRPYVKKIGVTSFPYMSSTHKLQVGYQYQLYVTGVPCFHPHIIVENEYEEKKFEDERMKYFVDKAIEVASIAVAAHTGLPITLDRPLTVEG